MKILISNDDGIRATGLKYLIRAAEGVAKVFVSAPEDEASATSHAITLRSPLRAREVAERQFAVGGTPTDCIYLALHYFCNPKPDLVLSGINRGPNLGLDVLYSGTVAAAMEAVRYGIPAIAFSLTSNSPSQREWEVASQIAEKIIKWFVKKAPVSPPKLLNVNIPPSEKTDLQWKITRLGNVEYPIRIERREDPMGEPYYWIGGYPPKYDLEKNTDCWAVQQGFVSITPLKLDLTSSEDIPSLENSILE